MGERQHRIRPYSLGLYRHSKPVRRRKFQTNKTTTDPRKEIQAHWYAPIPQTGKYAVYIAYRTVKNSTDDALYTVYHKGGKTQFKVNQSMGGGTWIYLGHFDFAKGENAHVELSNLSRKMEKQSRPMR